MDEIKNLVDLVKKCRENCPWCKEQTVKSYFEQVESEVKELKEAIEKGDKESIKEELGDVLWDTVMLLHITEHKLKIDSNEVIKAVNEKIKRRKPYIFSDRKVTVDEAMKIWEEEKRKEKNK